jgi:hypothetical protein
MQMLESILSLLVFSSILAALHMAAQEPAAIDDSLYRMQLANDAWRVLYLRGDFEDFGNPQDNSLEADMEEIRRQTALCLFLDGIRSTSCRGGDSGHEISVAIHRTVISRGILKRVSFSLGK